MFNFYYNQTMPNFKKLYHVHCTDIKNIFQLLSHILK